MKKNILRLLLAVVCLLSNANVSAYDFEIDGIYYDVVSFSELTCKIVNVSNEASAGDIVIPSTVSYSGRLLTVTEIGNEVFNDCSELTGITIPSTIISIGSSAFTSCI